MASEKRLIAENDIYALFGRKGKAELHVAYIDLLPRADAVEVVPGRWIDGRGIPSVNRKDVPVVKCSKCEIYFCDLINNHHYMYNYCPNCGAKMDEEREDHENRRNPSV